jgi:CotH kinase protein
MTRGLRVKLLALGLSSSCGPGSSTSEAVDASNVQPDGGADGGAEQVPGVGLPVVLLETGGRSLREGVDIEVELEVVEVHAGDPMDLDGVPRAFVGAAGVEIRGNSSTRYEKHNYGLETHDEEGQDLGVAILGFPKESDWVLHGPYSDKTYLRNSLTYALFSDLGRWQPRTRHFELVINGQYQGIYVWTEKVKVDDDRLDLSLVGDGDISGAYVVKREGLGEGEGWTTAVGTVMEHDAPGHDDITPAQDAYLRAWFDDFEAMMAGPNATDPLVGYPAWIDVAAWVDFALAQELTRNVDGYRKSAYLVKLPDGEGGTLVAGPLWDFNIAWGNANYCDGAKVEGWVWSGRDVCTDLEQVPFWWDVLWNDPSFQDQLRCRWEELRAGPLAADGIEAHIRDEAELLREAEARDHERWRTIGTYVWPNPTVWETWDEEIDWLSTYALRRGTWLDDNLPGSCG